MSTKQNKNYVLYELSSAHYYNWWDNNRGKDFVWYYHLYTRDALVVRCAKSVGGRYSILDNLSTNMNETTPPSYDQKNFCYVPLYFIARVDKEGNFYKVNLAALRKDVERRVEEGFHTHNYYSYQWASAGTYHPEFRKDPIPHTRHAHRHKYRGCTHSGLKKYIASNTDPEYSEYRITKYSNPFSMKRWDWDWYGSYAHNHNWKRQYKVKHQWEVHKNRHEETIKRTDKRNITLHEELETLSEMD